MYKQNVTSLQRVHFKNVRGPRCFDSEPGFVSISTRKPAEGPMNDDGQPAKNGETQTAAHLWRHHVTQADSDKSVQQYSSF